MTLLLKGGYVLTEDGTAQGPFDGLVEDGVIAAVDTDLEGDTVLDCTGATVMPGLIEGTPPFDLGVCEKRCAPDAF